MIEDKQNSTHRQFTFPRMIAINLKNSVKYVIFTIHRVISEDLHLNLKCCRGRKKLIEIDNPSHITK